MLAEARTMADAVLALSLRRVWRSRVRFGCTRAQRCRSLTRDKNKEMRIWTKQRAPNQRLRFIHLLSIVFARTV